MAYTDNSSCQEALKNFGDLNIDVYRLELRPFISKENVTHRIFATGLKPTIGETDLEKAFSVFGKVSERLIMTSKRNLANNAIVGFEEE